MGFSFRFQSLESSAQLKRLRDFLSWQDLGYPKYKEWVDKAENELKTGYKSAILGSSEGKLVADLIYQPHKNIPSLMEIKNLRVHPSFEMRYFAKFMLKQVEVDSKQNYNGLIVDTRADRLDFIKFISSCGFKRLVTLPLYGDAKQDIVFVKSFNPGENKILTSALEQILPQ